MTLALHISPPILRFFPLVLTSLPRFQLLSILHKLSISLTLSLEHLALLWTPPVPESALLSRAEMAVVNAMAESNHLLAGEVGPLLHDVENLSERKDLVENLKSDIVETLLHERFVNAHMA